VHGKPTDAQPLGGLTAPLAEAAAAGLLRAPSLRVQRELSALPYEVLAATARRTPTSIVSGAARHLAAAAAAAAAPPPGSPSQVWAGPWGCSVPQG
jgi:hypothetical protein